MAVLIHMNQHKGIHRFVFAMLIGVLLVLSPAVASAAVPSEALPSRGIEFFIVCLFAAIIAITFVPSLILTVLELLQVVLLRRDPHYFEHLRLAEELQAHPESRRRLRRFTIHQRVQHWILFVAFSVLAVTGFAMMLNGQGWASRIVDQIGGLRVLRQTHRSLGAILLAGFVYHLVYLAIHILRENRRTDQGLLRTFFNLPLVMTLGDCRHVLHLAGYLLFLRTTRPKGGRFSPEEKFEYFGFFWGMIVLGTTGLVMGHLSHARQLLPEPIIRVCFLIHSLEAFLAVLHIGLIHMVRVILFPNVFPFSPAMVTGNTPVEKLAESHAAMLEDLHSDMASSETRTRSEATTHA